MSYWKTYTICRAKIQSLTCAIVFSSLGLIGCSPLSMQLGSADVETPLVITGSLTSGTETAFADIDRSDRTRIAALLEANLEEVQPAAGDTFDSSSKTNALSWSNPATGNSGQVTEISLASLPDTGCVGFTTTANTIAGVRLYAGSACKDAMQRLVITSLSAVDA